MSWAAQVYAHSPVWAQHLMVSAYGGYWRWRRYGGHFEQELEALRAREGYSTAQWRAYQTLRLRELLLHAFEHTPYYRQHYAAAGITAAQLARFELEDLPRLPLLEKDALRRYGTTDLLSRRLEPGGLWVGSSGSTGTPLQIRYSRAFHQRISAVMEARVRAWAGLDRFTPRGMIGGRAVTPQAQAQPPFYRHNFCEKQTYFSAYHIAEAHAADYLKGMLRGHVQYMTGYATSNYLLAQILQRAGLSAPPLQAVITSSEPLTPQMREVFRQTYGCPTFDSYSGVENCALLTENPAGEMAIQPEVGIVELLDASGQPVGVGEVGEMVCTGLLNRDQPLIRYRCGDLARRGPDRGRFNDMPLVDALEGRMEEVIETRDGRRMTRFHQVFIGLQPVLEGQIIQRDPESYVIRVAAGPELGPEHCQIMIARLRSKVGAGCEVQVERVERIPRGPNGKFKAVVSLWKKT